MKNSATITVPKFKLHYERQHPIKKHKNKTPKKSTSEQSCKDDYITLIPRKGVAPLAKYRGEGATNG